MRHRHILPIFFVIVGLVTLACTSDCDSDESSRGDAQRHWPQVSLRRRSKFLLTRAHKMC